MNLYCIFDQINAALVRRRDLKTFKWPAVYLIPRTVHTASHKQAVMETSRSENHFNFYM